MGPLLMHKPHRATSTEKKSLSPSVDWNGTPTPSEVFISRVIPAIPGIPGFPTLIFYS